MSSAMGTQTRLVSGMDAAQDGLPFDPTIRIPPIHDPSPLQVISSHRPSPLEPSTAESSRSSNARLDSRAKALASARPLGGDTPIRPLDTSRISKAQRAVHEETSDLGPRKRQRTEYVQLPKPQKHSPLERNTSLDTIPRVNQLHQPPPSAARFPPITTNVNSPQINSKQPVDAASKASPDAARTSTSQPAAEELASADEPKKAKRNYTRGRRMWTDEETENLLKGVAKYGVGKWKRILNDSEFPFPPDRTAVDLKDRYRTCRMHEERKIERHANGDPCPDEPIASAPPLKPQRKPRKSDALVPTPSQVQAPAPTPAPAPVLKAPISVPATPDQNVDEPKNQEPSIKVEDQSGISFVSVNTVQDMAEALSKGSIPPKWSAENDANLSRGFQKHGFHWTAMSKDPEFGFEDRTGPQLRDRFRVKFPIIYQSSVPIDLPDSARGYDRDQRPRRRKHPKGGERVSLTEKEDSKNDTNAASHWGRAKNMSIADIIKPADAALTPRISKPSLPSMQSLCARVDAQPLPEPSTNGAALLNIQPLPDEDENFDESDYDDAMSEDDDGEGTPGEAESGDDYDDGGRVGEDVRNLGIMELLNDETEMDSTAGNRLPPFKSTYDDLNEDWGQNSITLPPLLLEAARPMFDLD